MNKIKSDFNSLPPDIQTILLCAGAVIGALVLLTVLSWAIPALYNRHKLAVFRRKEKVAAAEELCKAYATAKSVGEKLERIMNNPQRDPLDTIVDYFNVTSPVDDLPFPNRTLLQEYCWATQVKAVMDLKEWIYNSGRDKHGWNRTQRGERVTADKVFLGNFDGIWTSNVTGFKRDKANGKLTGLHKDTYQKVQMQARRFMEANHEALKRILQAMQNAGTELAPSK
jgi:hypothetical protein